MLINYLNKIKEWYNKIFSDINNIYQNRVFTKILLFYQNLN